jgi:hypothetical protein
METTQLGLFVISRGKRGTPDSQMISKKFLRVLTYLYYGHFLLLGMNLAGFEIAHFAEISVANSRAAIT